jgi:hypothetical protein
MIRHSCLLLIELVCRSVMNAHSSGFAELAEQPIRGGV